ncbi:MAG: MFS transporter [Coriobacteriales bacterium]|jgi:predicted MFS family arabinose efflux permease|nr:MFS transporter [Coriobacteriales bacterium]
MKAKRAWIVALTTIFAGIALALVQNKVAPCMSTLMIAFSIDMATAGWLSSLFSLVGIVVALPASVILKRFGPKKGGIFALGCAIIGSLIGVFTDNATILMATRIIEGIGVGLIAVIGPSLIAMWFPEAKRGLPMSIWGAYQMGAQAVMFFLGSALTMSFGWQGMWWFAGAACVIALVLYVVCVKSPRPEDSHADVQNENVSISEGVRSGSTWLISLVTMLFCIGCFGFVNWIATCWSEIFNWSEGDANFWVGAFSIGGLFAAVLIGALLNKLKNWRLFGMLALVFYGVISLLGMNMPSPLFIVAFVIIYAFADAGFPCVLWTMTAQTVKKPELAGVAMGVVCVGFNVGILLGPPITGAVAEVWGWTAASVLICATCLLSMLLLKFVRLYKAE